MENLSQHSASVHSSVVGTTHEAHSHTAISRIIEAVVRRRRYRGLCVLLTDPQCNIDVREEQPQFAEQFKPAHNPQTHTVTITYCTCNIPISVLVCISDGTPLK